MIDIRQAVTSDATWLQAGFDTHMGWTKPSGYFESVCRLQDKNELVLLIAAQANTYIGHCKVIWQPDYPHFKSQHIPEIQDLNVRPDYRRQGIATQLLDEAERRIHERSNFKSFNAFQKPLVTFGSVEALNSTPTFFLPLSSTPEMMIHTKESMEHGFYF